MRRRGKFVTESIIIYDLGFTMYDFSSFEEQEKQETLFLK